MLLRSDCIEFDVLILSEIKNELQKETNKINLIYELTREKMEEALRQRDLEERVQEIEDYIKQGASLTDLNKMLSALARMICKSQIKTISFQNMIGGI